MKLIICIGSACHLKGSRQVVETMQSLIAEHKLEDRVELTGTFCLGACRDGVSLKLDDELFSTSPEEARHFFERELLPRL